MTQLELIPAKTSTPLKIKGKSIANWKKWLKEELKTPIMVSQSPFATSSLSKSCVNDLMQLFLDSLNGKSFDYEKFSHLKIGWRFDKMCPMPGESEFINQTEYLLEAMQEFYEKTKIPVPTKKILEVMKGMNQYVEQMKPEYAHDKREAGFIAQMQEKFKNKEPITEKQLNWIMRITARMKAGYLIF